MHFIKLIKAIWLFKNWGFGTKILAAYFSISGNTRKAAKEISKLLIYDIYEIKPKIYYKDEDLQCGPCRSQTEVKDRSIRPELEDKNVDKYDTIFSVLMWYHSLSPSIILTFLES